MNSVEASCKKSTLDSFLCTDVSDVMAASVAGGALTAVSATAYALGPSTLTTTNTNSTTRQFGTSGSISLGWGTAVASGLSPKTNVSVFGIGNVVLSYTGTNYSWSQRKSTQSTSVSTGFAIAIDF